MQNPMKMIVQNLEVESAVNEDVVNPSFASEQTSSSSIYWLNFLNYWTNREVHTMRCCSSGNVWKFRPESSTINHKVAGNIF